MNTERPSPIWLVAFFAQVTVAGLLVWLVPTSHLVQARLIIVAPPVVSTSLVATAEALPGRPFEAVAVDSVAVARARLARGDADAVVRVDLIADQDALWVSAANGPRAAAAIAAEVAEVEATLGRTVTTQTVAVEHDRRTPYVVVLVSLVLGFAAALVGTWRRGTFVTSHRTGLRRFAQLSAFGALAGSGAALVEPWPTAVVVMALVVGAGVTTTALTALTGWFGLTLASLLFVLTAAPLGRFTPDLFIPHPWQELNGALLHGAGLDLARDTILFAEPGSARSWAIVAAWIALPALTLVLSRASARGVR